MASDSGFPNSYSPTTNVDEKHHSINNFNNLSINNFIDVTNDFK